MAELKLTVLDEIEKQRDRTTFPRRVTLPLEDARYLAIVVNAAPALLRAVRAAAAYREAEGAMLDLVTPRRELDTALAALGGGETDG